MTLVTDPKAFGRVAVLLGEWRCFASTARGATNARPGMAGPVMVMVTVVAPWMASQGGRK